MSKLISPSEKIFIAGASGMAGSAIYRNLKKKGYGNVDLGGEILMPTSKELNLLKNEEVLEWFNLKKPTVVILAAAKVGGILANLAKPTEFLLENLKIQSNVIETSWKLGVKRLLFLGSSCIYPKFAEQPIKEDSLLTGPLEQTNESYALAKITGIKLCQALRSEYGFDAISLMPTNLYGPGDNFDKNSSHVMASFIKKFFLATKNSLPRVTCWGTGTPMREFMHVDDLGEAASFVLENWNPNLISSPKNKEGKPLTFLNVGTGKDISIKDLAIKIAGINNFLGEISWDHDKPDGTPKKQLDISNLKKLGWEPKISLNDGIKSTLKYYEDNIHR